MKFKKIVPESPLKNAVKTPKTKEVIGGSNDWYGACSIETFSSASALSLTHEDAKGFLDYPTSFAGKAGNFWFGDGNVKVWAYEEAYDNWQDTYGMDAVTAFYHSGHGTMNGSGRFAAPLGGVWDGRDWAFSDRMAFANEELRYLFFSTCYSLRVSGNDSPVRTWWEPNKGGLRMLLGYETTSVDNGNYGRYFWEEWRKGKSIKSAFLDASWRISHNQVPVAMAVGANQADAVNRLNAERFFVKTPVTKGWYQWQWIGTLPNRSFADKAVLPKEIRALILNDKLFDDSRISRIANKMGITKANASVILFDEHGNRVIKDKKVTLNVNKAGALNVHFGEANVKNTSLIEEKAAVAKAKELIKHLQFDKDVQLTLGNIRHKFTNGGTMAGSGTLGEVAAVETIVQFRQVHKGVQSVNSDHGLVTVSIDNDGKVTNIYNSTKGVLGEKKMPAIVVTGPKEKATKAMDAKDLIDFKIERIVNSAYTGVQTRTKATAKVETLRDKIGYDFSENLAPVVHQKDVDINFGNSLEKRYKVRVPLMG